MRNGIAKKIALGGLFGAAAIVVMCLGGFIPLSTYVCPVICMSLLCVVMKNTDRRIAWAWYIMVSLLCVLMSSDKEAAAVFVFLGYYPIIKTFVDRFKLKWLIKFVFFNTATVLMYFLLIYVLGIEQVVSDYQEVGYIMALVLLGLGNVTFIFLDIMLSKVCKRF